MKIDSKHNKPTFLLGSILLISLFVVVYLIPLVYWGGKTIFSGYKELPDHDFFWSLANRTILISSIVSLLSVFAACPIALIWRISNATIQKFIVLLMIVPIVMGLLSRNYSWIGMFSSPDLIASMGFSLIGGNDFLYTKMSVYLVMSCVFVPIAFFIIIQELKVVTANHLDAARTLGTPDWKIVFSVILPICYRAIALALGFILAMSSSFFITPSMIGGRKYDFLSNVILTYVNYGSFNKASVLALLFLLIMSIPLVIITVYALKRRKIMSGY